MSQLGTSEECPPQGFPESLPWIAAAQSIELWIDAFHDVTSPDDFRAALKIRFILNRALLWGCCSTAVYIIYVYGCDIQEEEEKVWCVCTCVWVHERQRQTDRLTTGATKGRTGWLSWSICTAVPSRKACAWQTVWDPARQRQLFQHILRIPKCIINTHFTKAICVFKYNIC